MIKAILVALLLTIGCAGSQHNLGPEWRPLKQVVERDLPFVSDTASTTIGESVCVADLDEWLTKYPPGSAGYIALLKHEQIHSQRQLDYGVTAWISRYLIDKSFAWEEEQLGFAVQMKYLRNHGSNYPAEYWANILATKYRGMVSYTEALVWARQILSSP